METVVVKGKGARAQRLLDELEAATKGVTKQAANDSKGAVERHYLIDAPSAEEARKLVGAALGRAAAEFEIS